MSVEVTTCDVPGRRVVKVDGRTVAWIDRESARAWQVRERGLRGWEAVGRPFTTLTAAVTYASGQ